ncbi:MAG: asparagine synthase (glutamine-hydrolyzing) [Parcubacteria group bacterium]
MCGIAGIINPKEAEATKKMTLAIEHRGPDDEGYFSDEKVALGMRRLSIIDLAKGKQPIASANGRFLIFFNGEIYNYKELRAELEKAGHSFETESDTEVVLQMFEVHGLESLPRLRGMFALAIYDKEKQKLILARDFFGIKPLYYWENGNQILAFSSEIKSFLDLDGFKREVNDAAVFNYLSFQYNPLEETFFKGVFKLPPAHSMTVDLMTGTAEIKKYWQFAFKPDDSLDEEATRQKILETMKDSVSHHMIADVPVGSFLSGGIDSSIIATLMQKIRGKEKIKTFTVGFESLSESKEALETSEALESDHHEITVSASEYFKNLPKAIWHFDEPVADPSALGLYFLAREAAKHVKVVLSGEGSDELFGGYNIYLEPFARRKIAWLPASLLYFITSLPFEFKGKNYARRASQKFEERYIGNASVFDKEEARKLWKASVPASLSLENLYREARNLSESAKMQYIDIHTWLVGDILAKADKMTMAHSLELRVPFLDSSVATLASELPDSFKWRGGVTKYLLREAFKKVLPESVRLRKKLGFPTPLRDWLTRDRAGVYDTILENPYIKAHMNTGYIQKLIDDHLSKSKDNARKIYLLLALAIWHNVFIERVPLEAGQPL